MLTFAICEPGLAEDPQKILQRMDEVVFGPDDQYSEISLILTDRSGAERRREAVVWQKGNDKRLFRFTAPAAEAGIAFLSLPDDVMYLYMPAFGRERRIASHARDQSFAGTDFTYEDLEAGNYTDRYSSKLLDETGEHFVLELTPLPGVRSDYSRIVAHIHKTHYYPEKMTSYDRGGREYKMAEYTFEKKEAYWYAREIRMTNLRRNHNTRMIFNKVELNTGLDDQIFTVRNLTRY